MGHLFKKNKLMQSLKGSLIKTKMLQIELGTLENPFFNSKNSDLVLNAKRLLVFVERIVVENVCTQTYNILIYILKILKVFSK